MLKQTPNGTFALFNDAADEEQLLIQQQLAAAIAADAAAVAAAEAATPAAAAAVDGIVDDAAEFEEFAESLRLGLGMIFDEDFEPAD